MKRVGYIPENDIEEFMFLLGRLEALAAYMEVNESSFVEKKYVYEILGLEKTK